MPSNPPSLASETTAPPCKAEYLVALVRAAMDDPWHDTDELNALSWLASALPSLLADRDRVTECVAEAIYNAMRDHDPEGKHRPWTPRGNSLKQDEARHRARAAFDAARLRPEGAE